MVHILLIDTNTLSSNIFFAVLALVILIVAAEYAVKKILSLLNHYGYSTTFGGLTIFSLTTSFPEIFAHLAASYGILSQSLDYKIASATVLGANIGSDVIQQTLILGIVVLLMGRLVFKKDFLKNAYLPMIGTTLMTLVLAWDGTLSRIDGAMLFGTFIVYMVYLYKHEKPSHQVKSTPVEVWKVVGIALISLTALLISAHLLLAATENIVTITGIGGSLIGVLTLGVASAAPELFTALSGVRKKAAGISLGTLIGSNITNPLVAIGGGALLSTYWVPRPLVLWDLPMETITATLLLLWLIKRKGKLGRIGAIYLIGLYVAYVVVRISLFAVD